MTLITIIDADNAIICRVSPAIANRMEANFEIRATTDEDTRRFLSPADKAKAKRAHVRRVTGLAHPHDKVSDAEIASDFDAWVAAQGEDVFI